MTPAERNALHLRISEAIEPKESLPVVRAIKVPISRLSAWQFIPLSGWQPRDWTGDEAASGLLMDMMLADGLELTFIPYRDGDVRLCVENSEEVFCPKVGTKRDAIALAAAEWLEGRE